VNEQYTRENLLAYIQHNLGGMQMERRRRRIFIFSFLKMTQIWEGKRFKFGPYFNGAEAVFF